MNFIYYSLKQLLLPVVLVFAYQVANAQQASDAQIEHFLFDDCYNYHQESNGWSSDYLNLEVASDYVLQGGGGSTDQVQLYEVDNFLFSSTNKAVYTEWKNLYDGINKCNQVLFHLENTPANSVFRAEAKFTRAYNYFHLVTLYGGVPLLLTLHEKVSEPMARASVSEVYVQIEKDLSEAVSVLPLKSQLGANQKYKATKGAALTLLGDACINQQKWAEAKIYLDQVKNSGEYSLMANFADLWLMSNEHNSESVFEYEYYSTGSSWGAVSWDRFYDNRIIQLSGPRDLRPAKNELLGGWGFQNVTKSLLDLFDANGDVVRKNATLITPEYLAATGDTMNMNCWECTGYKSKKYTTLKAHTTSANGASPELNYGQNTVKMRYADVLLLLAEAEAHLGNNAKAIEYANLVRTRANLAGLPNTLSNSELLEAIFTERTLEFALEGKRYRDVVRWGKADQFFTPLGYKSATNGLWPIPASVILDNPGMAQNSGYGVEGELENMSYVNVTESFYPIIQYPWIKNVPHYEMPASAEVYGYNYAHTDSVLHHQIEYFYDTNNQMTGYIQKWLNKATGQWLVGDSASYRYNANKQLIFGGTYKIKNQKVDTINSHYITYVNPNVIVDSINSTHKVLTFVRKYTWDEANTTYSYTDQAWWYGSLKDTWEADSFEGLYAHKLTFDAQNNVVEDEITSLYRGGNLKTDRRTTNIFINDKLSESIDSIRPSDIWVYSNSTNYEYDKDNLLKNKISYSGSNKDFQNGEEHLNKQAGFLEISTPLVANHLITDLRRGLTRMFYTKQTTSSLGKATSNLKGTISICPNPSNGLITVSGLETLPTKVDVYNISGVKVGSEEVVLQNQTLNLNYLQAGSYVLKVANSNAVAKFIIGQK